MKPNLAQLFFINDHGKVQELDDAYHASATKNANKQCKQAIYFNKVVLMSIPLLWS